MRTCLICLFLALCSCLSAQSAAPRHEVGIQFSGINFDGNNPFQALYKKEVRPGVWRRARFLFGSFLTSTTANRKGSQFSMGLNLGREKRIALAERFLFYHGPEFGIRAGLSASDEVFRWYLAPSLGYALGFQHQFNDRWAMHLETVPSVQLSMSDLTKEFRTSTFEVNATSLVAIGIVRRW